MSEHFIDQCKYCLEIVNQCKCGGPRVTTWVVCDSCQARLARGDELDDHSGWTQPDRRGAVTVAISQSAAGYKGRCVTTAIAISGIARHLARAGHREAAISVLSGEWIDDNVASEARVECRVALEMVLVYAEKADG